MEGRTAAHKSIRKNRSGGSSSDGSGKCDFGKSAPIGLICRMIFLAFVFLREKLRSARRRLAWQQFHSRPGSALLRRITGVTGILEQRSAAAENDT
jgi:hypothetical protein